MEAIYNSQVSEAIDPLEVAKMGIKEGGFKCSNVHVFKYSNIQNIEAFNYFQFPSVLQDIGKVRI